MDHNQLDFFSGNGAVPCAVPVGASPSVFASVGVTSAPNILFGTFSSLCIVPWPRGSLLYKQPMTRVDVEGRFLAAAAEASVLSVSCWSLFFGWGVFAVLCWLVLRRWHAGVVLAVRWRCQLPDAGLLAHAGRGVCVVHAVCHRLLREEALQRDRGYRVCSVPCWGVFLPGWRRAGRCVLSVRGGQWRVVDQGLLVESRHRLLRVPVRLLVHTPACYDGVPGWLFVYRRFVCCVRPARRLLPRWLVRDAILSCRLLLCRFHRRSAVCCWVLLPVADVRLHHVPVYTGERLCTGIGSARAVRAWKFLPRCHDPVAVSSKIFLSGGRGGLQSVRVRARFLLRRARLGRDIVRCWVLLCRSWVDGAMPCWELVPSGERGTETLFPWQHVLGRRGCGTRLPRRLFLPDALDGAGAVPSRLHVPC